MDESSRLRTRLGQIYMKVRPAPKEGDPKDKLYDIVFPSDSARDEFTEFVTTKFIGSLISRQSDLQAIEHEVNYTYRRIMFNLNTPTEWVERITVRISKDVGVLEVGVLAKDYIKEANLLLTGEHRVDGIIKFN